MRDKQMADDHAQSMTGKKLYCFHPAPSNPENTCKKL